MGDFERRSVAEAKERSRKAQAKVDAFRVELTDERGRRCWTCRYWDNSISHIAWLQDNETRLFNLTQGKAA